MLDSWFQAVPAYRLAAFRVVLATTTLCNFLPILSRWLLQGAGSPATTATIPWVPHLPLPVVVCLLAVGFVAGITLMAGWRPSAAAAYLVALGIYGYALGNHSHNGFLHLLLLALVALSTDGLTLQRLVAANDTAATCPAWPERLLRLQLSMVYFHTAVDKMFSPAWGVGGLRLSFLTGTRYLPGIALFHHWSLATIGAFPGLVSVVIIAGEIGLAVGLAVRRLWPYAVAVNIAFALALEFLLLPAMFPWDLMALMILFLPAADRAYQVHLGTHCGTCQAQRQVLSALDWTRRLDLSRETEKGDGLCIETPTGRRFSGWRAVAFLPLALPAPFLSLLILFRFGSRFVGLRVLGIGLDDFVFVLLGLGAILLLPMADRGVARALFERIAPIWNRALCRALRVGLTRETCPPHRIATTP